jgi:hypothetical protein
LSNHFRLAIADCRFVLSYTARAANLQEGLIQLAIGNRKLAMI